MSFIDDAKNKVGAATSAVSGKVGDFVEDHEDSLKKGIDKVGDFVDDKSGGRFADGVDKAQSAASGLVDKLKD